MTSRTLRKRFGTSARLGTRWTRWPARSSRAAIIESPIGWSHTPNIIRPTTAPSSSPPSWMWKPSALTPIATRVIELGICLFEYDRQNGRIYKVLGSWEWFEDPGIAIPPEVTEITGITDEMVGGHRIDDFAVDDLLSGVVLIIAHNADFDRRFVEKRLPVFATKHWACSRSESTVGECGPPSRWNRDPIATPERR